MTLNEICDRHGLTPEGVDFALSQYQKIIFEITHGMLSKLTYEADHVLEVAQEPRVLTLYEIQTLPNGDETNAPVVTEQRVPIGTWDGGSICQWRGAAFVQETAEDHAYYNWDTYGQNWRCWTALPTKAQREAVKWD